MQVLIRVLLYVAIIGLSVAAGLVVIQWRHKALLQQAGLDFSQEPGTIKGRFIVENVNPLNPTPWNVSCSGDTENDDPLRAGTTIYATPFFTYNKTDYCENENYLNEFWCDADLTAKDSYGLCIFGCSQGACTESVG